MMAARWTFRRRVFAWLATYVGILTLVIAAGGSWVHERAEHLVWRSLLVSEMDSLADHVAREPAYRWQDSDTLSLYRLGDGARVPPALAGLGPGLHDDLRIAGKAGVALVRDVRGLGRVALVLDVTDFEAIERLASLWFVLAGLAILLVTFVMAWFGMARVVRPLALLAGRIAALEPERAGQRVDAGPHASLELAVIADAVNDYLARNQSFVERERAFVNSASHELRTPIAVITGATELALGQPDVGATARAQMLRVQRTARAVEQLVSLLLVLVRDPARLAGISDRVALDQLLPQIVEDHRYLTRDKELALELGPVAPCVVTAPPAIVQSAIGNLLRNAIENSDRGTVRVRLDAPGTVVIEDTGHGLSPEEVSALYARMARGDARDGDGIGLALIARVCEHLGWELRIEPRDGRGTRATLRFGAARAG